MKLACSLMSMVKTELVDLLANELAWTEEGKELQKVIRRLREAGKTGILHDHLLKALSPMRSRTLKDHVQTLEERGELRVEKEGKGRPVLLGRVAKRGETSETSEAFPTFLPTFLGDVSIYNIYSYIYYSRKGRKFGGGDTCREEARVGERKRANPRLSDLSMLSPYRTIT